MCKVCDKYSKPLRISHFNNLMTHGYRGYIYKNEDPTDDKTYFFFSMPIFNTSKTVLFSSDKKEVECDHIRIGSSEVKLVKDGRTIITIVPIGVLDTDFLLKSFNLIHV